MMTASPSNASAQTSSVVVDEEVSTARRLLDKCDYAGGVRHSGRAYALGAHRPDVIAIHAACLTSMGGSHSCDLFIAGQQLVAAQPQSSLAWFVSGAYYYAQRDFEQAKRFLLKCSGMVDSYNGGWILLGHTFAACREHDLAMNCYLRATKRMPNRHQPHLYLGMEYAMTNNVSLADKFLKHALLMAPDEPHVLHELGVLAFKQRDYNQAYSLMRRAWTAVTKGCDEGEEEEGPSVERRLRAIVPVYWHSLLGNMAQTCRKLNDYEEAIKWHDRCVHMRSTGDTFAARAICHVAQGRYTKGVDDLHKALAMQPNNNTYMSLLNKVLEHMSHHEWVWHSEVAWPHTPTGEMGVVEAENSDPHRVYAVKLKQRQAGRSSTAARLANSSNTSAMDVSMS